MDADIDDDVRGHVSACSECSRDLTLLRSLLNSEGPASDSSDDAQSDAIDPRAATAMADAAEPQPAEVGEPDVTSPPTPQLPPVTGANPSSRSLVAVIVGVVVVVGGMVLLLALWR